MDTAAPGSPIELGCIADDFTGATDLANELARGGWRVALSAGLPDAATLARLLALAPAALVISLKSRSNPATDAVRESLAAWENLRGAGARRCYFKYCSTFDSSDAGNIGPVAEALLDALGEGQTVYCPSFPANGRTVYRGHLFVGDQLLSDSPMRNHPVTPMTDANLVRVLGRQTRSPVGLLSHHVLERGAAAVRDRLAALGGAGTVHVVADGIDAADLDALARGTSGLRLVTGGSAFAGAIAQAAGGGAGQGEARRHRWPGGPTASIAGSCSEATRRQIAEYGRSHAVRAIDPAAGDLDRQVAACLAEARGLLAVGKPLPLVYSSADPAAVARARETAGSDVGARVEAALAAIAGGLAAAGVRRFIVAGGETSGAVVTRLGVRALAIGPEIATGVPWMLGLADPPFALALKSGNFGGDDFFTKAGATLAAAAEGAAA